MAVEVLPNQTVKHDGVLHKAGEIIHGLAADAKAELIKFGVVKDLEEDAAKVEQQAKEDAATIAAQAHEDEQMVRGQVEGQVDANVQRDLDDAAALAKQEGEPVIAGGGQPSASEVAATASQVE